MFTLLQKDVLIIKKYVLLMLGVAAVIPPFIAWQMSHVPQFSGTIGFVLAVIYTELLLFQYLGIKEAQYPKAETLLCAIPYPRSFFVLSKYLFFIMIYLLCCIIYAVESMLLPGMDGFRCETLVLTFLAMSVMLGIYLPVHYRFGYEKTKFFTIIVIIASPYLFPQALRLYSNMNLQPVINLPVAAVCGGTLLLSILLLALSALISIRFFEHKELA